MAARAVSSTPAKLATDARCRNDGGPVLQGVVLELLKVRPRCRVARCRKDLNCWARRVRDFRILSEAKDALALRQLFVRRSGGKMCRRESKRFSCISNWKTFWRNLSRRTMPAGPTFAQIRSCRPHLTRISDSSAKLRAKFPDTSILHEKCLPRRGSVRPCLLSE